MIIREVKNINKNGEIITKVKILTENPDEFVPVAQLFAAGTVIIKQAENINITTTPASVSIVSGSATLVCEAPFSSCKALIDVMAEGMEFDLLVPGVE